MPACLMIRSHLSISLLRRAALEGFDRLLALAPDESHIVPGHDPLVMKLYPAPSRELEGVAERLDVPPSGAAPVRADCLSGH